MPKKSAGILLYRFTADDKLQVFLVHPGGPFWAKKDNGVWSIPKGEYDENETPADAALREFEEETGIKPNGILVDLSTVKLKSTKIIHCFAMKGDLNPSELKSNTFSMEWPPKSGKTRDFPEVDRGGWFDFNTAREKLHGGQLPFLERLRELVGTL